MLDFKIKGKIAQTLEINLQPGEIIKSEPGAMIYMEPGIKMEGKIFDNEGSFVNKITGIAKRMLSGESLRIVYYENTSNEPQKIGLAPKIMGEIIGLQLEKDENFFVQSGAYLASTPEVDISIELITDIPRGIFGGDGFLIQKLVGPGVIFINAFGTLQEIELNNSSILVDNSALVGYTEGITESIEMVKGLKNMFLSGEGLTNIKLSGTGTIYLQNTSLTGLVDEIISKLPDDK